MQEMTAIAISQPGGPEVLTPVKLPVPVPKPGEILVKVKAAGVNRPDVLQRQGGYPPPPGAPLTRRGSRSPARSWGWARASSAMRRATASARWCPAAAMPNMPWCTRSNALPVPPGLSFTEAAAIPETFFTVWTNVFDRGRLKEGETLLVHGGSSGIGTTAIMLGKAMGAIVVVTAGSDEKCKACLDLGADHAINYRTEDFVAVLAEQGPQAGCDPRHGGRRLCGEEPQGRQHAWPHRDDRLPEGLEDRGRLDADHAEAADLHGLHPAAAQRGREGRDRPGAGEKRLAAVRCRAAEAHHLPDLPAGARRRRPMR